MHCTASGKPFYSSFGVRRAPERLGMPLSPSPKQARRECWLGHPRQSQKSRCLQAGGSCCLTCLQELLCLQRLGVPEMLLLLAPRHAGRAAERRTRPSHAQLMIKTGADGSMHLLQDLSW